MDQVEQELPLAQEPLVVRARKALLAVYADPCPHKGGTACLQCRYQRLDDWVDLYDVDDFWRELASPTERRVGAEWFIAAYEAAARARGAATAPDYLDADLVRDVFRVADDERSTQAPNALARRVGRFLARAEQIALRVQESLLSETERETLAAGAEIRKLRAQREAVIAHFLAARTYRPYQLPSAETRWELVGNAELEDEVFAAFDFDASRWAGVVPPGAARQHESLEIHGEIERARSTNATAVDPERT